MTDPTPSDLRYTEDHEWARQEDARIRIGVTAFAQESLGDIVFVELPPVGTTLRAGQPMGEIESTKSVADLYAPIDGTVEAVNDALVEDPGLVNRDPYGEGWLCLVETDHDLSNLLDDAAYRRLLGQ